MQKILVKNNKVNLIEILNNLFNKKVFRFTYLGKCRLKKMPEYNFTLYEFNVMLKDFSNHTIFIKRSSGDNIKENLFCYWQFCEENYNMHGNFYLHKASIRNEVFKDCPEYVQRYTLQLLSKNDKIWKASDINIIDLNKMKAQKINRNTNEIFEINYQRNNKDNTKEYLFIGII